MSEYRSKGWRRRRQLRAGVVAVLIAATMGLGYVAATQIGGAGGAAASGRPAPGGASSAVSQQAPDAVPPAGGDDLGTGPITDQAPPGEINPQLLARYEAAAQAAAADGVELSITSGARTEAEQEEIIDEAVDAHGTTIVAHRYVAPVEHSAHVKGLALDIGPHEGAAWMQDNGARFGLCQVYENEPWHYEPLIAPGGTCPSMYPDSSVWW